MNVDFEIIDENIEITSSGQENREISLKVEDYYSGSGTGTDNYENLMNLPSLDGRKIIGDVKELDPTVPEWAKETEKPSYNAEEIGAVDEKSAVSIEEINSWFN